MLGKTIYVWKVKDAFGGDPRAYALRAKQMGLTTVFVKAADEDDRYNLRPPLYLDNIIGPFIAEMTAVGIDVYGWHYIYGANPLAEANRAIERLKKYPFKGWVMDAEMEYDVYGMDQKAKLFCDTLKSALPSTELGLTTFRYPSVHQDFPWEAFMSKVDFYMPQVYWVDAHNPAFQLQKSFDEYRALEKRLLLPEKPYIPIGAAYYENGWGPTLDEIKEFHTKAVEMNLDAVSYWEWTDAILQGYEQTIADLPWINFNAQSWAEQVTAYLRTLNPPYRGRDPEKGIIF